MATAQLLQPLDISGLSLISGRLSEQAEQPWWVKETVGPRRKALPDPVSELPPINVWGFMKNAVGGDLLSMPMPLQMHEPLTHHQKVAEDLEYTELLDQAAAKPKGSIERLLLVGALPVTWYAAAHRTTRPLNCCWGETFELVMPDKRVRAMFETVYFDKKEERYMHAGIVEGAKWVMEFEDEPVAKLNGASIEIHNTNWLNRLTFDDGDVYEWAKVASTLNNLLVGKMYFSHSGRLTVACKTSPYTLALDFPKKPNMLSGLTRGKGDSPKHFQMTGTVLENGKALPFPQVTGEYNKQLTVERVGGSQDILWQASPMPENPKYGMTTFAMGLADMAPYMTAQLPPTDTRRRPDIRAFDIGDFATAESEKQRLERSTLSGMQSINQTDAHCFKPRWFQLTEGGGLSKPAGVRKWRYAGGYWEAREAGRWGSIPSSYFGASYLTNLGNEE